MSVVIASVLLLLIPCILFTARSAHAAGSIDIEPRTDHQDHLLLAGSHSEFGLAFELWCFEAGTFFSGKGEKRDDGTVVFTHEADGLSGTTTFTVVGDDRIKMEMIIEGPPDSLQKATYLGPCMQFWHSDVFKRVEGLPDFAERCLLYTDRGPVGMLETARGAMKGFDPEGEENNPPWTQWYVPLTRDHPGDIWSFGASGERPIYGLVGIRSQDGKWVTAVGSPNVRNLGQGWHDCIHHVPELMPYDYDEAAGVIRHKTMIYIMPNDPKALLAAYREDFADYESTSLKVSSDGAELAVSSPDERVGLTLTGEGLEEAVWESTWWDAWTLKGDGVRVWAHAYGNDLYLSAAAVDGRSIHATLSGDGWAPAFPPALALENTGQSTSFFWERADASDAGKGLPGKNSVLRGRLNFQAEGEGTETAWRSSLGDWERSVPIKLPVE